MFSSVEAESLKSEALNPEAIRIAQHFQLQTFSLQLLL